MNSSGSIERLSFQKHIALHLRNNGANCNVTLTKHHNIKYPEISYVAIKYDRVMKQLLNDASYETTYESMSLVAETAVWPISLSFICSLLLKDLVFFYLLLLQLVLCHVAAL